MRAKERVQRIMQSVREKDGKEKNKNKNHLTDEVNGREFKFIWKLLFYCYVSGMMTWHHLSLLF